MKKPAITLLLLATVFIIALTWLSATGAGERFTALHLPKKPKPAASPSYFLQKLKNMANEARLYTRKNKYNTSFCFLIDMSLPSGQNRFFIYDLLKDTIHKAGLVTHGRCNEQWLEGRRYSNRIGGGCTSLGKYKIGPSYHGLFGLAFKLFGMEKTNDQAFKRYVVLHSHSCVPEKEVMGEICQSDGCPTVSPGFLKQLESLIRKSDKPVLLWIME